MSGRSEEMETQTTAAYGARRVVRRATSNRWLQLSLAVWILAVLVAVPTLASDEADRQLDFGADMAKRGLWKEALFRFQQAARHDPENPRILNNVAVSYEALGLFDKALETYQKALRFGPDDRELRNNYTRFVEFYQSFKPQERGGEPAVEASSVEPDPEGETDG